MLYHMKYYSMHSSFFVPCYTSEVEQFQKIDKFLNILSHSGACELIMNEIKNNEKGGRPLVNPYNLFAAILYCFAFEKGTLREIEDKIKYDLRLKYIMQGEEPSYKTIGNFINEFILPNQQKLFKLVTEEIFNTCEIDMKKTYIDGSKFEANANKYKFVWKPTTFHEKLSDKIRLLLDEYKISRGVKKEGIIESKLIAEKLQELSNLFLNTDLTLKENKKYKKSLNTLTEYLAKSLEYEEKERICGQNRKSYYKTDYDATAMCLKEDYYSGLGSNMHAGYNTQISVSYGFVTCYYVSQSRNDVNDFVPLLTRFNQMYNTFPFSICADAGYGSEVNYLFMKENNIKSFVKYVTWEGNKSGKKPSQYKLNEDNTIMCLNGNIGIEYQDKFKHHKKKNSTFYIITGCNKCAFCNYCKRFMKNESKELDYKIFEVNQNLQQMIQESENNLLSIEGIEMRVNRSIQVEGVFGNLKQNFSYERFRRRSIKKVSVEFMLLCMGSNIRKLFKYFGNNLKLTFWKVPENIKKEEFKKPSPKKISKNANKVKNKSVNQKAKDSYTYK